MSASSPAVQSAAEFVHRLFVLIKSAGVYGPENEAYRAHSFEARTALCAAMAGADSARLEEREDLLFFNESPLRFLPGDAGARFIASGLRRRGVATVEFRGARSADELDAFVAAFRKADPRFQGGFGDLVARMREAGVTSIVVLPAAAGSDAAPPPSSPADSARRVFGEALGVAEQAMTRVREGREPDFDAAKRVVGGLAEQVAADAQALFELSVIERFDEYTYAHCVSVSVYSVAIGVGLGLEPARLRELGFAGLFHDVGKAKLPRELIDKPGELDEHDWRLMRRHPGLGARELLSMKRPFDAALAGAVRVAFEHHLGLDGTGYPRLARPRRQGLYSRVCAVADAFDAMTSGRVYAKRALSPDEAVRRLIHGAHTAFDPLLLRVFLNAAGVYPIGTSVLLDSGERAVVRRNAPDDLLRPQVAVFADDAGPRPSPCLVALGSDEGAARVIRRTLDPALESIDAPSVLRAAAVSAAERP